MLRVSLSRYLCDPYNQVMTSGGIVAVGDSIINADKSWGYRLAQTTGMELTRYSVGGSTSTHALEHLGSVDRHYWLAAVTVGTNDALFSWKPERFEENVTRILEALTATADHVLIQTIPVSLSQFPGSGRKVQRRVETANRIIAAVAERTARTSVVDGADLRGHRLMSVDRVHPSLLGQLALADRAATILALPMLPSSLHDGSQPFDLVAHVRGTADRTLRAVAKRIIRHEPATPAN